MVTLSKKQTIHAHGQRVVLVYNTAERPAHSLMKGLLWALYLPDYPDMKIECRVGDRYKPDVVSLDAGGAPLFWGEAGKVGRKKIHSLARRFPQTHFAIAKWDTSLRPFAKIVGDALAGVKRSAPFDLIAFPADSGERFFDGEGNVRVGFDSLNWQRFNPR